MGTRGIKEEASRPRLRKMLLSGHQARLQGERAGREPFPCLARDTDVMTGALAATLGHEATKVRAAELLRRVAEKDKKRRVCVSF